MSNLKKIALTILAAAFCASTPVIAADVAVPTAPQAVKPDLAAGLKDKAANVIEQGKTKVDNAAQGLEKSLGVKQAPNKNATQGADQVVDVNQESVTVETPQGTATETVTTVTPEAPATAPEAPAAPAK